MAHCGVLYSTWNGDGSQELTALPLEEVKARVQIVDGGAGCARPSLQILTFHSDSKGHIDPKVLQSVSDCNRESKVLLPRPGIRCNMWLPDDMLRRPYNQGRMQGKGRSQGCV